MAKLSRFATDQSAEVQGVWLDGGAGLQLRVARLGSTAYTEYLRRAGKGLAVEMRLGMMPTAEMEELTRKAVSKHILLDWRNLEDDAGQPIPYSSEKALELFNSHPDFYKMVLELSSDAANFKSSTKEQDKGNS